MAMARFRDVFVQLNMLSLSAGFFFLGGGGVASKDGCICSVAPSSASFWCGARFPVLTLKWLCNVAGAAVEKGDGY